MLLKLATFGILFVIILVLALVFTLVPIVVIVGLVKTVAISIVYMVTTRGREGRGERGGEREASAEHSPMTCPLSAHFWRGGHADPLRHPPTAARPARAGSLVCRL